MRPLLVWSTLSLGWFASAAFAQEENVVRARVLFVNGQLVQVDQGQESGVEPGDTIWLRPLGASALRGTIHSVQRRTSWLRIPVEGSGIEIGTAAEILITPRPTPDQDPASKLRDPDSRLPSTPPVWSSPATPFDPNQPLLTDLPRTPEERTSQWSGRVYTIYDSIRERESRSSTSTFARFGSSLRGENPFGGGGTLLIDFDLDARSFRAQGESNDLESAVRVQRFSYGRGGDRRHPLRWHAGRFLPFEFPEFGVLDGAEVVYRLDGGDRVGASAGFLPEPGLDYHTGDDFQLSVGYRGFVGDQGQYNWAVGLQKSWHEGVPDRDLAVLQASYFPGASFSWTNSAWIDFYGSSDSGKDRGPELSLWTSFLSWNRKSSGSTLGFRHWRFPRLLRFQGGFFTADDLINARTSRLDGSSWMRLNRMLRLSARADVWRSEDRDGAGADLRLDLDSLFGTGSSSWVDVYYNEGSDNQVGGIRFGQGVSVGPGRARIWYDGARYRPLDGEGSLTQHDLRLSWNYWSPSRWNFSLDVGRRFGDDQDSYSVGLFVQRSF